MTNAQVVEEFCRLLVEAPNLTMTAVQVRLSASEHDLILRKKIAPRWNIPSDMDEGIFPITPEFKGVVVK